MSPVCGYDTSWYDGDETCGDGKGYSLEGECVLLGTAPGDLMLRDDDAEGPEASAPSDPLPLGTAAGELSGGKGLEAITELGSEANLAFSRSLSSFLAFARCFASA